MEVRDTIADYIRASLAGCPTEALISPRRLDEIASVASLLPGALTEFFGFECPLGTDEPLADFLVCSGRFEGGCAVLAGANPMAKLPDRFEQHWVWQRIRAFASEWNDPRSPLHEAVSGMWLEFDMDGARLPVPVPSVFIGSNRLRRGEAYEWLTAKAIPLLNGASEANDGTIARCIVALPEPAYIFQMGWMLSRQDAPTRICIRGISTGEIIEYLRTTGWQGVLADLGDQLEMLSEYAERIDLDLDIGGRVLPKIGLECYPAPSPDGASRLIDWLARAGHCGETKAEWLKLWAGIAHEKLRASEWPTGLLAASSFLRGRAHSVFVRWLHHVKVVFEPGMPLRAKAYLGVRHVWMDPAVIKAALSPVKKAAIITESKLLTSVEEEVPCKS